jgi:hypothetical protein
MSSRLKVLNGTRSALAPRLCDTCQSGVVQRGAADSDEHIYCTFIRREVRTRVVECNVYSDRSQPSLYGRSRGFWTSIPGGSGSASCEPTNGRSNTRTRS